MIQYWRCTLTFRYQFKLKHINFCILTKKLLTSFDMTYVIIKIQDGKVGIIFLKQEVFEVKKIY